jgi:hypothetical protein
MSNGSTTDVLSITASGNSTVITAGNTPPTLLRQKGGSVYLHNRMDGVDSTTNIMASQWAGIVLLVVLLLLLIYYMSRRKNPRSPRIAMPTVPSFSDWLL